MVAKRGKLYKSVVLNLNNQYCQPSTYNALNEAKRQLKTVETIDQLNAWINEWFGEVE